MKYVEQVLQPGETIIYATSLHWLVYLRAIVLFILAVVLAYLVVSGMFPEPGVVWGLKAAAAVFGLWALFSGLNAFIRRTTTELAVTDRRVIFKTGVFRRNSMEMNRSKVETVGVNQSILGRILGYGTVTVRGTGGSFEPVPFIGDPLAFRSTITAG